MSFGVRNSDFRKSVINSRAALYARDRCSNIYAAWLEVMDRTNEVHINIPMKAKNTNRAAFKINTFIIKMILLSLC
jgi:hypothetical protein